MSTINQRVIARARNRYGLRVFTRAQWGSKYSSVYETRRRTKPAKQPADTVVQHITVTLDHGDLAGSFFADVRTVERIGYERFKSGVSYNWIVDMVTGDIAEGQPLDAKGTHTVNNKDVPGYSYDQNYAARAIAVLGMPNDKLSAKAARAISGLLAAMMDERAITTHFDYVPHSLFAWKECPSDSTRGQMGDIRKQAFALRSASTTPPPTPPRSSGMSWNVKANRSWTKYILPPLVDILAEHKPSVVALQECYDAPDLRGLIPGYAFRYQALGYEAENPGYIEEHSANVMLVRDDVEVKVQAALEMEETWKGPNLGIMHDPRIHRRLTVEEDGINWRYGDVHAPPPLSSGFNNDAIAETNAAIVHCLNTFPQDEPIIFMGDMNQTNSQVVTRIGSKADAVVDGGGIDLAVYKNCRKVKGENLGNFGSDHPVKIWTFEA